MHGNADGIRGDCCDDGSSQLPTRFVAREQYPFRSLIYGMKTGMAEKHDAE
jgi:hypothetical protein